VTPKWQVERMSKVISRPFDNDSQSSCQRRAWKVMDRTKGKWGIEAMRPSALMAGRISLILQLPSAYMA
jgi:hypothetical protein